jgi:calcium-dependent phosphoinositide phospholipase C
LARRPRRALIVAIAAGVVLAAGGSRDYRLDDKLRLNQVQVLATHNSYHIQQDAPIPASPTTQYTHGPLDQQLDLGVRGFELDIVNAPDGQFPVLHTPVVDATSNCTPLTQCLDVLRRWSRAHPRHVPMFVLVEPKEGGLERVLDPNLETFDVTGLDELDSQVRSSLGRHLITPDSVRGKSRTLRDAVLRRGWLSLGKTRGKIMVILHADAPTQSLYLQDHSSLQDRAMFVTSEEASPAAAVLAVDNPDEQRIQGLIKQGFIVRTRADADLVEARANDVTRRERALSSGAQIISTDFEVAVPAIGTDYVVQIPGGTPARCNPVNAPKDCRSKDVENPARLRSRR